MVDRGWDSSALCMALDILCSHRCTMNYPSQTPGSSSRWSPRSMGAEQVKAVVVMAKAVVAERGAQMESEAAPEAAGVWAGAARRENPSQNQTSRCERCLFQERKEGHARCSQG
jgi:hypothetical protein